MGLNASWNVALCICSALFKYENKYLYSEAYSQICPSFLVYFLVYFLLPSLYFLLLHYSLPLFLLSCIHQALLVSFPPSYELTHDLTSFCPFILCLNSIPTLCFDSFPFLYLPLLLSFCSSSLFHLFPYFPSSDPSLASGLYHPIHQLMVLSSICSSCFSLLTPFLVSYFSFSLLHCVFPPILAYLNKYQASSFPSLCCFHMGYMNADCGGKTPSIVSHCRQCSS